MAKKIDVFPIADEANSSLSSNLDKKLSSDEQVLAGLGYKQEFKREFGNWTSFCVSFSLMGLLPSFASVMVYSLEYGGTGGMAWGWIISMIPIQCIACSLGELCSAMPTSGGLYYAAAVLAPDGYGPLAAWITGWSHWIAQVTGPPSGDYALASMILAGVSISDPSYTPKNIHLFLLSAALLLIHASIASLPTKAIARLNSFATILNLLSLLTVLICIPAETVRSKRTNTLTGQIVTPRSSREIWGTIHNGTDYPDGISVLMSFIGVIWIMSGYDAAFHLSEECSNANIAAPRAIVMTSSFGGILGWALQIMVAYTIIDVDSVLDSSLGQPWASYLLQILPQRRIALAILALTISCSLFMGQAGIVTTSRVTYAYARDDCFGPLSKFVKVVNKKTKTPVNAVFFNTTIGIGFLLLIFGGPVAINAIFSIAAIAVMVAFSVPILMRVIMRKSTFKRGPWHLGKFGRPVGAVGVCFVALMGPIMCLPAKKGNKLNAENMNWTCVVYGSWMLFISLWWVISARHWFRGPKVNLTHKVAMKEESWTSDKGI